MDPKSHPVILVSRRRWVTALGELTAVGGELIPGSGLRVIYTRAVYAKNFEGSQPAGKEGERLGKGES